MLPIEFTPKVGDILQIKEGAGPLQKGRWRVDRYELAEASEADFYTVVHLSSGHDREERLLGDIRKALHANLMSVSIDTNS